MKINNYISNDYYEVNAFEAACYYNLSTKHLKLLIKNNINVNQENKYGQSVLIFATQSSFKNSEILFDNHNDLIDKVCFYNKNCDKPTC